MPKTDGHVHRACGRCAEAKRSCDFAGNGPCTRCAQKGLAESCVPLPDRRTKAFVAQRVGGEEGVAVAGRKRTREQRSRNEFTSAAPAPARVAGPAPAAPAYFPAKELYVSTPEPAAAGKPMVLHALLDDETRDLLHRDAVLTASQALKMSALAAAPRELLAAAPEMGLGQFEQCIRTGVSSSSIPMVRILCNGAFPPTAVDVFANAAWLRSVGMHASSLLAAVTNPLMPAYVHPATVAAYASTLAASIGARASTLAVSTRFMTPAGVDLTASETYQFEYDVHTHGVRAIMVSVSNMHASAATLQAAAFTPVGEAVARSAMGGITLPKDFMAGKLMPAVRASSPARRMPAAAPGQGIVCPRAMLAIDASEVEDMDALMGMTNRVTKRAAWDPAAAWLKPLPASDADVLASYNLKPYPLSDMLREASPASLAAPRRTASFAHTLAAPVMEESVPAPPQGAADMSSTWETSSVLSDAIHTTLSSKAMGAAGMDASLWEWNAAPATTGVTACWDW